MTDRVTPIETTDDRVADEVSPQIDTTPSSPADTAAGSAAGGIDAGKVDAGDGDVDGLEDFDLDDVEIIESKVFA